MNLPEICIKRPVLTIVLSLVLILVGILAYSQLELRSDPKVFRPKINVEINVPGASPQYVENSITTPLENALRGTENLSFMESESSQGRASINVHFKSITEQEFLTTQSTVTQAIDRARLPQDIDKPIIRAGGESGEQLMLLSVASTGIGKYALSDYVKQNIVEPLMQIAGVGSVQQYSPETALRISLLPKKMAELGVSITDVKSALQGYDVSLQAGQIINAKQALAINVNSIPKNIEQFENILVKQQAARLVRLKDIANVSIQNTTFGGAFSYYNGKAGIIVNVNGTDDGNPIKAGELLRAAIKKISRSLPPETTVSTLWDQTIILQHSVHELFATIVEAIVFVAIITFLFLGSLRFTLIPVVTIPVCILASFAVILLLGFSINLMTLLALVLAVGLVVDDAIVVLENACRHVELGQTPFQATLQSMREVTFPVIGMTLSIVAVYMPTAFMRGKTAVYFQQFAFTLAGAVLISGFVALTLTPMMCARMVKSGQQAQGYALFIDAFFDRFRKLYRRTLIWMLAQRWLVVVIFVALLGMGGYVFEKLPNELMPKDYAGLIFMGVQGPDSASISYMNKAIVPMIKTVRAMPEVKSMVSFAMPTNANFVVNFLLLQPHYMNAKPAIKMVQKIQSSFKHNKNVSVFATPIDLNRHSQGGNPGEIDFYVQGYIGYQKLVAVMQQYATQLKATGLFKSVKNNLRYSSQQYNIDINHAVANQVGVSIATINSALSTFFGGYTINNGFQYGGMLYPVIMQLPAKMLRDFKVLQHIFVNNLQGKKIALSNLVTVNPTIDLPQRTHINGERSGEIAVVPNNNVSSGLLVKKMQAIAKSIFPAGVSLAYTQHTLDLISGNNTMVLIFGLGILFVFLVFAALFESFIDPLIILLTVPLCIVGAIICLHCIGGSLNIYTGIGLVTLVGLVSKHGVLITHFANQRRAQGEELRAALIDAATIRLRPILMTTATMTMGALPLVLASGVGSVSRVQVGAVIISGLIMGTLFSLFIVPVAYTYLARFHKSDSEIQ